MGKVAKGRMGREKLEIINLYSHSIVDGGFEDIS